MRRLLLIIAAMASAACEPEPSFPADYAKSYVEVRNCRPSSEHDSHLIRVLASPSALSPYRDRDAGFPEGAVVLKEERDFGDVSCSGPVLKWTVMTRRSEAAGVNGWLWETVSAPDRRIDVKETNSTRCTGCHAGCGRGPDGFEGTCAVP
ncbi:MAG: cytochrome P460 family protein [Archangium sp.]|nr:cytochrome P460 family protein [Archangium sp.]